MTRVALTRDTSPDLQPLAWPAVPPEVTVPEHDRGSRLSGTARAALVEALAAALVEDYRASQVDSGDSCRPRRPLTP